MDRRIVYPAQIPLVEDQLMQTRFTQKALGYLAQTIVGESGTGATGFDWSLAGGMTVSVGPGQIIALGEADSTSYGALGGDNSPLLVQYLFPAAGTLEIPGVGQTYIVYGTLSVQDQHDLVLPFYNSANPSQTYAGPDNNGASSATVRASLVTIGIANSVPSGSVPLWQIVVPSGATSLTSEMISAAPGAPFYPSLAATAPRTLAPFNASLAASFGGYPLNALVADATTSGVFWQSTKANNLTVPGSSGAAWVNVFGAYYDSAYVDANFVSSTYEMSTGDSPGLSLFYSKGSGGVYFISAAWSGRLANEADLLALQTAVQTAQSAAESAQTTANTGVANAATAQSTANTAVANAATAQTTAENAQTYAETRLDAITNPTILASSGSVTIPSWATRIEVVAVGGGGGGASCQASGSAISSTNVNGGGGGAGAYAKVMIPVSSGDTVTMNIGAAGASDSTGGDTTVYHGSTLILTCGGGSKSGFTSTANCAGGAGGAVTLSSSSTYLAENSGGNDGGDGQNGNFVKSGVGGGGPWGGSGRDGQAGGENANGYGAGGGGAYDSTFSGNVYSGGHGYQGVCIYRFLP